MRSLKWDRDARIAEVRDRIWTYLSPASRLETLLLAAALLNWPEAQALRLGELQFLLCKEVGEFLDDMPRLMRKLATASIREEEWTTQRLRGPVEWGRTLALRSTTGSPHLYVTAPARRIFQTPENEFLVHVLDAVVDAAHHSGWDRALNRQGPAKMVRERLSEAIRWQQSHVLANIDRVAPVPRSVARIRTGRNAQRYAAALAAYDRLTSLVEQMDREAVRAIIENAGLVTSEESILFELVTTFHVMDALTANGWQMTPLTLLEGHVHTIGISPDGRHVDLWYQSTPPLLSAISRYRQVLSSHGLTRRGLRPDMVLQWSDSESRSRWLLIECKLSQVGVDHAARQALADLLAYRHDYNDRLADVPIPYGLGVAWGEDLRPDTSSEVALCTPDTLNQAISQIIC